MDGNSEIFDIVNDNDEVIGSASRDEVHKRGLKHRSVHLLIFNKQGSVLLQKGLWKRIHFPELGTLQYPGMLIQARSTMKP